MEDIYKEWYHLQILLGKFKDINGNSYNKNICTRMTQFYYLHIKPWIIRLFAFIFIILSVFTILSEITLFTNLPLSIFGIIIETSDNIIALNILSLIPLNISISHIFIWLI